MSDSAEYRDIQGAARVLLSLEYGPPTKPPEWTRRLFPRIHELLKPAGAMEHYRDMVRRWADSMVAVLKRWVRREKRRHEHIDAIEANPQLQDKDAKPPRRRYIWGQFSRAETYVDQKSGKRFADRKELQAWGPPDLVDGTEPVLPTHPHSQGDFPLEAKYAFVAALYDRASQGVEKVDPWPPGSPDADCPQAIAYHALVDGSPLITLDEPVYLAFLVDVEADLVSQSDEGGGVDDSTLLLSAAALARRFGVPGEPLRKRLERLRQRDHTCFVETDNPGSREAKYLYKVGRVRDVVLAVRKASSETSSKRPTKKKGRKKSKKT